ncbi:BMP/retinoic acid-inducible neural-specific protein 3-like [Lampetra fluviatilis]
MHWPRIFSALCLLAAWDHVTSQMHGTLGLPQGVAAGDGRSQGRSDAFDWLLTDRGPFHEAEEYKDFLKKYSEGYTVRYKIYREFARWKVSNIAVESRAEFPHAPLPLSPEFMRSVRQLGRRPTQQQLLDNFIRKYGTHYVVSGKLGGEEKLTILVDLARLEGRPDNGSAQGLEAIQQLAASYFINRESTLRRLHEIQITGWAVQVTETRKGPLGCSSYENLDLVSSVLIHSTENKIQLQGLQTILPDYIRERFVRAALGYLLCNAEGDYRCHGGECACLCLPKFPNCNCPESDIATLESSIRKLGQDLEQTQEDFTQSEEFKAFVRRLPPERLLNSSVVFRFWTRDDALQARLGVVRGRLQAVKAKISRAVHRLYSLSRRCPINPAIRLPAERPLSYWMNRVLSALYCSENGHLGSFHEATGTCACPKSSLGSVLTGAPAAATCQRPLGCTVGAAGACAVCPTRDQQRPQQTQRCVACNPGYALTSQGRCELTMADPDLLERLVSFEAPELDLHDDELHGLLARRDHRLVVPANFVSNDMRLGSWFDPAFRKRMLVTLKSNKLKPNAVHMLLGIALQLCQTKNSTLEPLMAIYVNPFGGSHTESWHMPVGEESSTLAVPASVEDETEDAAAEEDEEEEIGARNAAYSDAAAPGSRYPSWEIVRLDSPGAQCYNYSIMLGAERRTLFETVHVYLRSQPRNDTEQQQQQQQPPAEPPADARGHGHMKVNSVQAFGYSTHFDADAMRDMVRRVDRQAAVAAAAAAAAASSPGSGARSAPSLLLQQVGSSAERERTREALQLLLEARDRVNRYAPLSQEADRPRLDLFSCLLRHRLRLSLGEVGRVGAALQAYSAGLPSYAGYKTSPLC